MTTVGSVQSTGIAMSQVELRQLYRVHLVETTLRLSFLAESAYTLLQFWGDLRCLVDGQRTGTV